MRILALALILVGSIAIVPHAVYADKGGEANCPPNSNAPQCQSSGGSTGDEGSSGSTESTDDEGESASTEDVEEGGDNQENHVETTSSKGGRSWHLVVLFFNSFNEQGLTQETIPESTSGISLEDAINSDLGYNYFDTLRALGLLGIEPMDLTEAQMVWLLENFLQMAGIVTQ